MRMGYIVEQPDSSGPTTDQQTRAPGPELTLLHTRVSSESCLITAIYAGIGESLGSGKRMDILTQGDRQIYGLYNS